MTNFPGKDKIMFWQERKRLKQEIRRTILATMLLTNNLKDKVVIERFVDHIEPDMLRDKARLPYVGNFRGNAKSASKIQVVFAAIYRIVYDYWTFVHYEDIEYIPGIEIDIRDVRNICDNYENLTVHGDPAKGYWLE